MNEDGLLPCPFCGSAEVSHSVGSKGDGSDWPYVECESCAAATEPDVWNRRSDADAQAEIARLRGALESLETDAHSIFNSPPSETPQVARDVIEWYAGSIRAVMEPTK